jgi:hypothetical protein
MARTWFVRRSNSEPLATGTKRLRGDIDDSRRSQGGIPGSMAIGLQRVVFRLVENIDLPKWNVSLSQADRWGRIVRVEYRTVLLVPMTIWRAETPEVPMIWKVPGVWARTETEDARETARAARRLGIVAYEHTIRKERLKKTEKRGARKKRQRETGEMEGEGAKKQTSRCRPSRASSFAFRRVRLAPLAGIRLG